MCEGSVFWCGLLFSKILNTYVLIDEYSVGCMVTQQTKRRIRVSIIGKYLWWMVIRVVGLIVLFVLISSVYRFGGLEFL